jgi:hypothetical protein
MQVKRMLCVQRQWRRLIIYMNYGKKE